MYEYLFLFILSECITVQCLAQFLAGFALHEFSSLKLLITTDHHDVNHLMNNKVQTVGQVRSHCWDSQCLLDRYTVIAGRASVTYLT